MKMIKGVLIVAALMTSLYNIHGMEPERPQKVSWKKKVKNALLGKSSASFTIGELPEDIKQQIIALLMYYDNAQSLKEAGQTIRALSQVNKNLNTSLNEPQFCYELIKSLAQKFKTSDEEVAKIIRIREAQRQYHLQKQLYAYICDKNWSKFKVQIQKLCKDGADINFVYKSGKTLLMYAAKELDISLFDFIIEQGADINYANYKGLTPLMVAVESASLYDLPVELQKLVIDHKNFNMNQQDEKGDTALMHVLKVMPINIDVVKILVDAGAHPELANFKGVSPLTLAKKSNMNSIVILFENAMPKKSVKK